MGKRNDRNPTGGKIGMAKIPGVEEGKKDQGNSDPEVSRQQWLTFLSKGAILTWAGGGGR